MLYDQMRVSPADQVVIFVRLDLDNCSKVSYFLNVTVVCFLGHVYKVCFLFVGGPPLATDRPLFTRAVSEEGE